ncbi:MAG: alkaline phosphatase family protein [bacterium]
MRPVLRLLILALGILLAWGPLRPLGAQTAAPARHVVLLSLDGARADAVKAAMPTSLAARGTVSWTAQTVWPSSTMPAHASMLSGVSPAIHKVTFNDWRSGQPYFRRPTIFTEVTRAGGRAAAFVHKPKLLMFMPPGSVSSAQHLMYPRLTQADVVEHAARYLVEQRPAFLFVHVADPDDAGHRYGWMTPRYIRVIAGTPALVERFLRAFDDAGVSSHALLIVTADHGGHWITHGTRRPEDMTIPWMAFGGAARSGVVVSRGIVTYDTAATVLVALGVAVPSDWQGRPVHEGLSPSGQPAGGGTDGNPRR